MLDSWDCPNLPTLAPMLRLLGDSGHNFLEKGGNSSKSFNLCAKTSAESGKNPTHLILVLKGRDWTQSWGKGCRK